MCIINVENKAMPALIIAIAFALCTSVLRGNIWAPIIIIVFSDLARPQRAQ